MVRAPANARTEEIGGNGTGPPQLNNTYPISSLPNDILASLASRLA